MHHDSLTLDIWYCGIMMIGLFDLLQAYCKYMLVIVEFSVGLYSIFNILKEK